jgi:hypothetical protein
MVRRHGGRVENSPDDEHWSVGDERRDASPTTVLPALSLSSKPQPYGTWTEVSALATAFFFPPAKCSALVQGRAAVSPEHTPLSPRTGLSPRH